MRVTDEMKAEEAGGNIAVGLELASAQTEEARRRFPVGTRVRENRIGSPSHEVIGHSGNMVHTTGGHFHVTKLVRGFHFER